MLDETAVDEGELAPALRASVCLQCGPLGADAPEMCATCHGPVYHLSRPSERTLAEYAAQARRERRAGMAFMVALIPGLISAFGLTYITGLPLFDGGVILFLSLPYYPFIALFMKRVQPPGLRYLEQHLPGLQRRFWPRLVTALPVALALALIAIHLLVDDLGGWWLRPEHLRAGDDLARLVTGNLVHGHALHLIANLIGLLLFGIAVDLRVGRSACAVLLLASGVAGLAVHGLFTEQPALPVLGASGMVYGLIGAELALMPTRKLLIAPMGVAFELPNFVGILLFVGLYTAFDISYAPHVAWLAHVGGFAAGVLLGLAMRRIPKSSSFEEFEAWREERLERAKRESL